VLLLVLILVLVAFGLLVVALLTGNVLSAWLSVAVSVAAAVVLIIDWLQRRSAVKAGKAGAESTSAPSPQASNEDLDPVTEVLPVYSPESEEPGVPEKRFDRAAEGQQTVVMPAVQPSGSAARPSGAEGPSTPSGGSSSPRVTESASEEGAGARVDKPGDSSDAESTVVVDIRKAGIGRSSAGADAPVGAAGSGSNASGADAESGATAARSTGGSGVAGAAAAGLAGAAVAGGATKDTPHGSPAADTHVVDVRKPGLPGDRADDGRPAAGAAASASEAGRPAVYKIGIN